MKVLCFGTFDLFHKGHEYFLREARKQGDSLAVVVARDETVVQLKGRYPIDNEKQRLKRIAELNYVDEAHLGMLDDKYKIIEIINPGVICLGYDQEFFIEGLGKELADRGVNARIKRINAYKPQLYKSSKLR